MADWHYKENRKRKTFPLDDYLAAKSSRSSFDSGIRGGNSSSRSGYINEHDVRDHRKPRKGDRSPSTEDISDSEFPDNLANYDEPEQHYYKGNSRHYDEEPKYRRHSAGNNVQRHPLYSSHRSPSPESHSRPTRIVVMSSTDLPVASTSSRSYPHGRDERLSRSPEEGEYFEVEASKSNSRLPLYEYEKSSKGKVREVPLSKKVSGRHRDDQAMERKSRHGHDERSWDTTQYHQPSSSKARVVKPETSRRNLGEKEYLASKSKIKKPHKDPDFDGNYSRPTKSRHEVEHRARDYFSDEESRAYKDDRRAEHTKHRDVLDSRYPEDRYDEREEAWNSHHRNRDERHQLVKRDDKRDIRKDHHHSKDQRGQHSDYRTKKRESHHDEHRHPHRVEHHTPSKHQISRTPPRHRRSDHSRSNERLRDQDRRERAKLEFNYGMWTKGGELRPNHLQEPDHTKDSALPDSTSDGVTNFDDLYAMADPLQARSNYLASLSKDQSVEKEGSKDVFEKAKTNESQEEDTNNKIETYKPLTTQMVRYKCRVQCLDRKFLSHLSEMHPTSALHELCTRLEWPAPEMSLAFEFGPQTGKMYIFKAVVNGQSYQPAIAVENKKDAKANCAWFALQEMGFVKKDLSNPL